MIILYPTEGWNSFTDIAFCDTFLSENVPSSQKTAYEALLNADKEIYIKQATTLIKQKITLPETLEEDLQIATCYLVNYSIGLDMLNNNDEATSLQEKTIDKGTITKKYFKGKKRSTNSFPDIVTQILKQYGYKSSGAFEFVRA